MWINTQLQQNEGQEQPHMAKIVQVDGGLVNTLSHIQAVNIPVISSFGISAIPIIGDDVLLMPTQGGGYCCVGKATTTEENEVLITSPSGGFIHLMQNGFISLNGLIISSEGKIV